MFKRLIKFGKRTGVPELCAEISISCNALHIQFEHPAERGHRGVGKAQCICAKFVDNLQRVDHVACGLTHFFALSIPHQTMQVDGVEGHLINHGQLHHHHPRNPEK